MFNKEVLTNIFKKLLVEAKNSYDDFNSADGKIGDGDLGVIRKFIMLLGICEVIRNL